jgi:hypothetical protein
MRRKSQPKSESVIAPQILEQAKRSISPDTSAKKTAACSVCGAECAVAAGEQLCWVCRRLKISAWKDIEQQAPAQE